MEAEAIKIEGMSSIDASDFVYEVIRGAGKVGGYIQNILTDTIYYAEKYVTYIRNACSGLRVPLFEERLEEGKITIMHLVRNESAITEADKREFYMNFGRDMVEITKKGVESESLTVIDLSKYGI